MIYQFFKFIYNFLNYRIIVYAYYYLPTLSTNVDFFSKVAKNCYQKSNWFLILCIHYLREKNGLCLKKNNNNNKTVNNCIIPLVEMLKWSSLSEVTLTQKTDRRII